MLKVTRCTNQYKMHNKPLFWSSFWSYFTSIYESQSFMEHIFNHMISSHIFSVFLKKKKKNRSRVWPKAKKKIIIIVVLPSSGISEKVGSVQIWSKRAKFGCIFHHFSQKAPNLSKIGCFPDPTFFNFYFWIGSVAEGNTTFFFLGLIVGSVRLRDTTNNCMWPNLVHAFSYLLINLTCIVWRKFMDI